MPGLAVDREPPIDSFIDDPRSTTKQPARYDEPQTSYRQLQ
jgi:hypothetical protein